MSKSYRIRTTPGDGNGYLKVNLDLNQNYDHLEILSLKISQADEYRNFCSDYGVVAGRVIVNDGFGVPNVKVSIFVPVEDIDLNNPLISQLYPYTEPFPDQKNVSGIRYNVLPKNKQTFDHTPVGTFPKKREVLDDVTTLEIYEKYYKYTTTTNVSGDYILFGVPVGDHFLHYDMDVSDIGFISLRPYELISQGYSDDLFDSRFKFKSSNNLDSLAQIFSENLPISVEPYWCDSLSVGSPLGINRFDIQPNIVVTPTSIFMGSIFSDDERDSINKNCKPSRKMGKMAEVITNSGEIESIRRNIDGGIETFKFNDNTIDENGNWSVIVPMNIRKVVTDEFGNLVPSPDGKKGIATEGDYRFRISMDATDNDKRLRQRAKFLVPNTNNNFSFGSYSQNDLRNSDDFTINEQLSTLFPAGSPSATDTSNQYNYLEEFYPFRWKKVYTVKQYIGRLQKVGTKSSLTWNNNQFIGDEARGFTGIKDIVNSEGVNKFPSNRFDTNIHPLYIIICILLSLVGHIIGFVNGIIMIINGLITAICNFKIPVGICKSKPSYNYWTCTNGALVSRGNCGDGCSGAGWPSWYPGGSIGGYCQDTLELPMNSGAPDYAQNNPAFITACCQAVFSNSVTASPLDCSDSCPCDQGWKIGQSCYQLKFKCLFSSLICKKCNKICTDEKCSCCIGDDAPYDCATNDTVCGDVAATASCCDGLSTGSCAGCCVKIPLIKLKCADEELELEVALLPSIFSEPQCNRYYIKPFQCFTCGGIQTRAVKDWVSCVLEPVAVFLKMLKFDFYNDWVGGTLYFPLIKRKYKLKKSKRKFGQIKKDKFCDFDCIIRNIDSGGITLSTDFQGEPYFNQNRIKLSAPIFQPPTINSNGCIAKIRGTRVSNWYGNENSTQAENLDLAATSLTLKGKDSNGDKCNISFSSYSNFQATLNPIVASSSNISYEVETKEIPSEHGKPAYIETEDSNGNSTMKNIGGHGHHRNFCDNTRMVERNEYFKTTLDCLSTDGNEQLEGIAVGIGGLDININFPGTEPECTGDNAACECYTCNPSCGSNGVAPCINTFTDTVNSYNLPVIEHGLISWHDGVIYYTPVIPDGDLKYNQNEYKANLLLPTTIMELGSSVYCDIDDVPFIMDQLEPTTFNASFEDIKYRSDSPIPYNDGPDTIAGTDDDELGVLREITKFDDKKDSSLNLRAYAEFSCISVVCLNTSASVNQSQIGVDMIDKNDIGIEIGNCFLRFEHEEDIRSYFCKRFNGYKSANLDFHHSKPGSMLYDNVYNTYPEITLNDGNNLYYEFPTGEIVKSEYNDGDAFIPGDACGYSRDEAFPDYFYGLAPGQTSGFINYPNSDNTDFPAGTINTIDFGDTAYSDGVDDVDDDNNGLTSINGIRFNRSQTPYYLYFGLVPGKTALHKTVSKFFGDKINAVTLQGLGASDNNVSENINNSPNLNNPEDNPFTVYKTCLGESLVLNIAGSG
ncbi:MAG: hypothetical protein ACXACY_17325, partial [Candidatus Hodarchaeales archaeon]